MSGETGHHEQMIEEGGARSSLSSLAFIAD